jgi:hypothetical protein
MKNATDVMASNAIKQNKKYREQKFLDWATKAAKEYADSCKDFSRKKEHVNLSRQNDFIWAALAARDYLTQNKTK